MTDKQKLQHLKQAVSNFKKNYSYDFKPFLITYSIFPDEDGTYSVYDSDGLIISEYNSLVQVLRFIFTCGDFTRLNP